ncbi:uncharacterized protein TRIVIDRAFT_139640, partial [Trichoderma virens Gv29-8]
VVSVAALATLVPFATARNCKKNLDYCGSTLLDIGNYEGQIISALGSAGKPTDNNWRRKSLFYCAGGPNGEIQWTEYCGERCVDAGKDKSDYC